MFRIDTSDAATTKPTRGGAGPNPNGHFTSDATTGTTVTDDWAEAVQEEISGVVETAGLTLDKADDTQLYEAIVSMFNGTSTSVVNPFVNYAHFRDEKASGTAQQSLSSGYNVRDINTESGTNPIGITLSANQLTIPEGEYRISATCNSQNGDNNDSKLLFYNVSDASYSIVGMALVMGAEGDHGSMTLKGAITVPSGGKVYELRQFLSGSFSATDSVNDGTVEVYSEIEIWKLD